ncbi:MAG: GNAT family N-acetyltransferase [Chloroflexota bacterium]
MKITDHSFTNDDAEYNLIKELLLEIEGRPEVDNNWDPGRMDYWRYNVQSQKAVDFFKANARYWKVESDQTEPDENNAGQVVGLFITEYGKDDFFIVVHPSYWELFSEILNWGRTVWARGKTKITTDVYTFGQQKIDRLTAAGFYEDGHVENVRMYPLANYDFGYALESGFKLMSFSEYGNYESKVNLMRNAFENPNLSEARYRALQSTPSYLAELDLVIVNPEGESVAYCTGWVQENDTTFGYIEPMGTHSEYRQRSFGKALAKECFKRLANLGVETAWIASNAEPDISNFLYDSLNPESVKRSYRYALNLE